ncbi:MAG: hypothetical protein Q4B69_01585 [Slackia sp.]|nr:hypothetical protein [Slackia sp.]
MKIFGFGASELLIAVTPAIALFVGGAVAGVVLWLRAKSGANTNSCAAASLVMGIIAAIEGTIFGVIGIPFALVLGLAAIAASRAHKTFSGTQGNNASTAGLILGIVGVAMCVIGLGQTGIIMFSTGN